MGGEEEEEGEASISVRNQKLVAQEKEGGGGGRLGELTEGERRRRRRLGPQTILLLFFFLPLRRIHGCFGFVSFALSPARLQKSAACYESGSSFTGLGVRIKFTPFLSFLFWREYRVKTEKSYFNQNRRGGQVGG